MSYDLARFYAALNQIKALIRTNPEIAFEKAKSLMKLISEEFPLGDDIEQNKDRFTLMEAIREVRDSAMRAGGAYLSLRNPKPVTPYNNKPINQNTGNVVTGNFGKPRKKP